MTNKDKEKEKVSSAYSTEYLTYESSTFTMLCSSYHSLAFAGVGPIAANQHFYR
jgi:hypothetical protein